MIETTLKSEVLAKYKTNIFVETGTCEGGGVALALSLGFDKIYSIEINLERQLRNMDRFIRNSRVTLLTGDSGLEFPQLIPMINEQATFWLDAHCERKSQVMRTWCPLYEELAAISRSSIKNHIIMIDDMRVIGVTKWGKRVAKDRIINMIMTINPEYKISYEDNTIAQNDILVAKI